MTGIGDNSKGTERLKEFVTRIERLDEEISSLNTDKRDIYAEAKSNGYNVKALREVIRKRRDDPAAREAHDADVDVYMAALGMIPEFERA